MQRYINLYKTVEIWIIGPFRQHSQPFHALSRCSCYPLGTLSSLFLRKSMPRLHEASGPVTTGCFSHLFPVRIT